MGKWWENHDWRFIQTNLREIDMIDIDARQYVRDLQSFGATVAMINTSGIIASYPTKLPYHYQSPYLTGDSLQTIIKECHEHGIKVMARTDFSKVRRLIYEQHPDWAFIDVQGRIVDYEGDIHVCINSDYQQIYALEIIRETLTELDVDGIFFNMGGYVSYDYSGNQHGICQCDNCRTRFIETTGMILPEQEDMADPAFLAYLTFKRETTAQYNRKVCEFIKQIRPDVLINHDIYTEDSGFIRQESNTGLDRALPHWQYSGSENTKWVRGSYPSFISSNTSVDFIDFPSRHAAVSPYQQSLRLYQGLANGGSIDYYLIGRLDNHADRSGYAAVRQVFAFHQKNQIYYRDNHADCQTVILTGDHWGGHGSGDMAEFFGLYRILTETHHLFDVMLVSEVTKIGLGKYKTIILPNIEGLDQQTAACIDQAVLQGATLLVSGKTGSRDENLNLRSENALRSLDWIRPLAMRHVRGAYFQIDRPDKVCLLADTDLIMIDGPYHYAEYSKQAERYCRLIPPQPFGPPERCYSLYPVTDHPAAVKMKIGQGQVVYLPWTAGKLFYRQGYFNTFAFLADLFEQFIGLKPVAGNIPPTVEVTLLKDRQDSFRLLHLINNNGHFGNSFYQPSAISDLQIQIQPGLAAISEVISLVYDKPVEFTFEPGILSLRIPRLENFEALLIR